MDAQAQARPARLRPRRTARASHRAAQRSQGSAGHSDLRPPGVGKTRLVHEALRQRDEPGGIDDLSRPTDAVYYTEKVGERESRAVVVMAMVTPYGATLPRLPRELLRRFGDEGQVAYALASRVRSTPRAVTSLIEFKRRQLANVERWAEDELVEVRRWAARLAEELRDAIAEDEAHELFRRKLA